MTIPTTNFGRWICALAVRAVKRHNTEKNNFFINLNLILNLNLYGKYTKNDGIPLENEKPLLNDMMNQASTYIDTKKTGATFYFGHDMNLMRLVSLLGIDGYCGSVSEPADFYKVFSDFKIAPMAGNIQLTFYRHGSSDDILVKFMLNEKECNIPIDSNIRPYYHWTDVKSYMKRICSK